MRAVMVATFFSLPMLLGGCLFLQRGSHQSVKFATDPIGAKVTVGKVHGFTPCSLKIKRRLDPHPIRIELEGREAFTGELSATDKGEHPGIWLGAIVDGLLILPGIFDLASGCLWVYPYEVSARLPPKGHGTPEVFFDREYNPSRRGY